MGGWGWASLGDEQKEKGSTGLILEYEARGSWWCSWPQNIIGASSWKWRYGQGWLTHHFILSTIFVIPGQWESDKEKLYAMKHYLGLHKSFASSGTLTWDLMIWNQECLPPGNAVTSRSAKEQFWWYLCNDFWYFSTENIGGPNNTIHKTTAKLLIRHVKIRVVQQKTPQPGNSNLDLKNMYYCSS